LFEIASFKTNSYDTEPPDDPKHSDLEPPTYDLDQSETKELDAKANPVAEAKAKTYEREPPLHDMRSYSVREPVS